MPRTVRVAPNAVAVTGAGVAAARSVNVHIRLPNAPSRRLAHLHDHVLQLLCRSVSWADNLVSKLDVSSSNSVPRGLVTQTASARFKPGRHKATAPDSQ